MPGAFEPSVVPSTDRPSSPAVLRRRLLPVVLLLGKISVLLCFQDTLKIFTLLAWSRCPALARMLIRHLARKKARTILPRFLPSFLPSQSPTAKPSLSPSEDPTRGSSCCRGSKSLTSGQSAARVQASFVPESGPTSAPMVGTVVRAC